MNCYIFVAYLRASPVCPSWSYRWRRHRGRNGICIMSCFRAMPSLPILSKLVVLLLVLSVEQGFSWRQATVTPRAAQFLWVLLDQPTSGK